MSRRQQLFPVPLQVIFAESALVIVIKKSGLRFAFFIIEQSVPIIELNS